MREPIRLSTWWIPGTNYRAVNTGPEDAYLFFCCDLFWARVAKGLL